MSDLGDEAAARARRQRQAAQAQAARYAEAERAAQQDGARLRERAREFFVFARDHGARTFRLYTTYDIFTDSAETLTRTDEMCVLAARWDRESFSGTSWAVTAGGTVYDRVTRSEQRRYPRAWRRGIRDTVFAVAADTFTASGYERMRPHFVAAAALLDSVPANPGYSDALTGVQKDGWIGYLE